MFSDNFRRGESEKSRFSGVKKSKLVSSLSDVAWKAFQSVNRRLPEGEAIRPNWAPGPLLKSYERTAPPLGFPRETDSLCPRCVKEVREGVISGATPLETLMHTHPGEIKAQIVEENGQVVMRKTCPKHGEFVDVMATDARFLERIESLFFGRDFRSAEDTHVHHHGTSNIKFGRGAVLTVDLTNRCNMMCNPCFMDANQVGYVHEPTFEDTKAILDRAVSFKPKPPDHHSLLGRRADAFALLSRSGRLREEDRLLPHPRGDQRHPLRRRHRVLQSRERGRTARRLSAVRRRLAKRRTSIAASAICST